MHAYEPTRGVQNKTLALSACCVLRQRGAALRCCEREGVRCQLNSSTCPQCKPAHSAMARGGNSAAGHVGRHPAHPTQLPHTPRFDEVCGGNAQVLQEVHGAARHRAVATKQRSPPPLLRSQSTEQLCAEEGASLLVLHAHGPRKRWN
jgi:hypothetical protein